MRYELDDVWADKMEGLDGLTRIQKRRLYRVIMVCAVGFSYGMDTILLALFNEVGVGNPTVVMFYGYAGLGHVVLFSLIHGSGLSDKSRNPHWTIWQMIYSISVQVISATMAPKLTAFFMGIMFIIYAFGTLRISLKEALLIWLGASVAMLIALVSVEESSVALWVPNNTQGLLVAVAFSLILLRSIGLGYYSTLLRIRMYEKSNDFESAATHDMLTGLYNRSVIMPAIKEQIALIKRNKSTATLAMLDIDNFKSINDNMGHAAGDNVLSRLGSYLESQVRESDMVGRYGGEEFVFLMPTIKLDAAMAMMERIREDISQLSWRELGRETRITISCGVAEVMEDDTVDSVIKRADDALYMAKRAGKNRVVKHQSDDAGTRQLAN